MITFREEVLQIGDIDNDFEIGITVCEQDDLSDFKTAFINEPQAKQIVEHFKIQFGWE